MLKGIFLRTSIKVKIYNDKDDNDVEMDDRSEIHNTKEYIMPTKSPATILPSTLEGLKNKLYLLLAEYEAGIRHQETRLWLF